MNSDNPSTSPNRDAPTQPGISPGIPSVNPPTLPQATSSGGPYPVDPLAAYQAIRIPRHPPKHQPRLISSIIVTLVALLWLFLQAFYFLAPLRTNLLILGIDRAPQGTALSRTDTIILTSIIPLQPAVNMLFIPRDLWVIIPGVGENRINTAHFFAEANQPGSGPAATALTIREDFEVPVYYYVRLKFDGFQQMVDAMGGVTIDLPEAMAGYPAGKHHLNGEQALAFVRDRKGTDDFFRMDHARIFIRAVLHQALFPLTWLRLPALIQATSSSIDSNLPVWLWPRFGLAFLRAGVSGIHARTLPREAVTPYTTPDGADVLLPNWDVIRPIVLEMFF